MTDERWPTLEEIEAQDAGRIDEGRIAGLREHMRAAQRAYQLAEIRKALGLTQTDVAAAMHVSQRRVSAVERGDIARTELGTVASYVQALGGRVEIIADFGDRRVVIGLAGTSRPSQADADLDAEFGEAEGAGDTAGRLGAGTPLGQSARGERVGDGTRGRRPGQSAATCAGRGEHREVGDVARPVAVARSRYDLALLDDRESRRGDLVQAAFLSVRWRRAREEPGDVTLLRGWPVRGPEVGRVQVGKRRWAARLLDAKAGGEQFRGSGGRGRDVMERLPQQVGGCGIRRGRDGGGADDHDPRPPRRAQKRPFRHHDVAAPVGERHRRRREACPQ